MYKQKKAKTLTNQCHLFQILDTCFRRYDRCWCLFCSNNTTLSTKKRATC